MSDNLRKKIRTFEPYRLRNTFVRVSPSKGDDIDDVTDLTKEKMRNKYAHLFTEALSRAGKNPHIEIRQRLGAPGKGRSRSVVRYKAVKLDNDMCMFLD